MTPRQTSNSRSKLEEATQKNSISVRESEHTLTYPKSNSNKSGIVKRKGDKNVEDNIAGNDRLQDGGDGQKDISAILSSLKVSAKQPPTCSTRRCT
jgi:hypothetical protein